MIEYMESPEILILMDESSSYCWFPLHKYHLSPKPNYFLWVRMHLTWTISCSHKIAYCRFVSYTPAPSQSLLESKRHMSLVCLFLWFPICMNPKIKCFRPFPHYLKDALNIQRLLSLEPFLSFSWKSMVISFRQ